MANFILIKKKGAKNWMGTIPGKKGASKTQLKKSVSKNLKKGFAFRIVTRAELLGILKRMKPRTARRKVRRKKKR